MAKRFLLMVGTEKGAFLFRSDAGRRRWTVDGPHFKGQGVNHLFLDARDGETLYAGASTDWWGADVYRSRNLGKSWQRLSKELRFQEDAGLKIKRIWHIAPGPEDLPRTLFVGVDPAALFRTDDGGKTWQEIKGLNRHPTRDRWAPGFGGLILHTIYQHPTDRNQIYVAISAAGVFRTTDGGQSWTPCNRGTRADFLPEKYPEVGQCVHKLAFHPSRPHVLFQQNHCGVYRSDDAGDHWKDIGRGLPSRFGFPILVHPSEPETLYVIPEESDNFRVVPDGQPAVYRSRNGGRQWEALRRGLPPRRAYLNVLREAMAADAGDPAGIYFGTTAGQVFASRGEGTHWYLLADGLPRIYSVKCARI